MEVTEVLYNTTYGGFWLPNEICKEFEEKYGEKLIPYHCKRDDPRIVELFKKYENREYTEIDIAEVPKGCFWKIREYDGQESVSWTLPESIMIDDLRKVIMENTREGIHPITEQFLESGMTFVEFNKHFREKFNLSI
jgi:hypothetical protein